MKGHEQSDLASYYERRAPVYDAVYDKPERQDDLTRLQQFIPPVFADRDVLEVAAGDGLLDPIHRKGGTDGLGY